VTTHHGLPDIPESAWQRQEPAAIVRAALSKRAHSRTELVALCGSEWLFKEATRALGDSIERAIHNRVAYFRMKPDGQGPQETLKP